ncbi:MAG: conjugal transfer protein TraJ [Nitrosomonas sp. PRO4]|nr:conjugal transfer protein TraJ [Nitrosomonas sp. PRO4]
MVQKRLLHLRVPVTLDEEQGIKTKAHATGLSAAKYMRMVSLGYTVPSVIDNQQVEKLLRINGDLGRVGGLLKMWLTNDVRLKITSKAEIEATLATIRTTQNAMLDAILELRNRKSNT